MATEIDLNFNNGPDPQDDYNPADTYYKPSNIPSRIESANPDLTRKVLEFVSQQKRTKPEDLRTIVGPDAMRQRAFFEQMVKERIVDPLGRTLVKQVENIKVAPLSPMKLQENLAQGIVDYQQERKRNWKLSNYEIDEGFAMSRKAKEQAKERAIWDKVTEFNPAMFRNKQSAGKFASRWSTYGENSYGLNVDSPLTGKGQATLDYDAKGQANLYVDFFAKADKAEKGAGKKILQEIIAASQEYSPQNISGHFTNPAALGAFASVVGKKNVKFKERFSGKSSNISLEEALKNPELYISSAKLNAPTTDWAKINEQVELEHLRIRANDPKGPEFGPSTIAIGADVKSRANQRRHAANRQNALDQLKADKAAKDPVAEAEKLLEHWSPRLQLKESAQKYIDEFSSQSKKDYLENIQKQAEDAKKKAQQDYKNYLQTRTKEYNTRSRELQEAEIDIRNNRYESSRVRGLDILGPLISESGIQDSNKALEAIRSEGYKLKDSFNEDKFKAKERRDSQLESIRNNLKDLKTEEWQPSDAEREVLSFSALLRQPDFFGDDPASVMYTKTVQEDIRKALRTLPENHPIRQRLQTEIAPYDEGAISASSLGPGSPIGDYRSDTPPVHNPIVEHPEWNSHLANTAYNLGKGPEGFPNSLSYQGPNVAPPGPPPVDKWSGFKMSWQDMKNAAVVTGPAIGAAYSASQVIQHGVDTSVQSHLFHSAGAKDFINDESKVLTDFADKTLNPYGINVAGGAAVSILKESFAVLQSIDKGVDSMAKDVKPFAPETIEQDVLNQIAQLQQNIKLGEELDPLLAEYSAARNEFQMAWNEVRAEIIQDLIPVAIDFMKSIKPLLPLIELHVRMGANALNLLSAAAQYMPFIGPILNTLQAIDKNTNPNQTAHLDNQVLTNINNFFNLNQPLNNAQKPKRGNP